MKDKDREIQLLVTVKPLEDDLLGIEIYREDAPGLLVAQCRVADHASAITFLEAFGELFGYALEWRMQG